MTATERMFETVIDLQGQMLKGQESLREVVGELTVEVKDIVRHVAAIDKRLDTANGRTGRNEDSIELLRDDVKDLKREREPKPGGTLNWNMLARQPMFWFTILILALVISLQGPLGPFLSSLIGRK